MWITSFRVEGSGDFPLDMLRYDTCYPLDENALLSTDLLRAEAGENVERVVYLEKRHAYKPEGHVTDRRWASFGWRVIREGDDPSDHRLGTVKG